MSDCLRPHGLHPLLSPRVCLNSYSLSQLYYLTISSSATPFSFCLQAFQAPGFSKNFQNFENFQRIFSSHQVAKALDQSFQWILNSWISLGLISIISLLSKGLSRVFSRSTIKSINSLVLSLLYGPNLTSIHDYWKNHSFDYTDLCQ